MFKKFIISLLSLFVMLCHTEQTFAVRKRTNKLTVKSNNASSKKPKLSAAAQAFFEPGNHDDAKLHILGYLLTRVAEISGELAPELDSYIMSF